MDCCEGGVSTYIYEVFKYFSNKNLIFFEDHLLEKLFKMMKK